MEDAESEKLCACLTRTVANKPADEFYQEFNLISSSLSEYYFKEMKEDTSSPGMELWPKLMTLDSTKESHRSPPIYLSLVCFLGPSTLLPNSPNYKKVDIAHTKAREMLHSSFSSKEDHKCIDVAMDNFPMIAIFMAQVHDHDFKKKKNKKQHKSRFDVKDTSSLHCLAAVNYF